jgi:hypothetical protein
MGVDIVILRARIGLFGRRKNNVTLNSKCVGKAGITNMWFLRLIIATLLIVGGVELNPGAEMEEKVLEILTVQREGCQ